MYSYIKYYAVAALLGVSVLAGTLTAYAEDPIGMIPVKDRRFEGLSPKSFQLGKFNVFASVDGAVSYTSNVFLNDQDEITDRIASAGVASRAEGAFGRLDLELYARGQTFQYDKTEDWNHTNYASGVRGLYDLSSGSDLTFEAGTERLHQTRSENPVPDDVYDPVAVTTNSFKTTLILNPTNTQWAFAAEYKDVTYDDTHLNSDDSILIQRDRDHQRYTASARVAFTSYNSEGGSRLVPFFGLNLSRAVFDRRNFEDGLGFVGQDQDSTTYSGTAGVEFSPGGKLQGRAAVGYALSRPDEETSEDLNDVIVDIDLTYLYTPLTNFIVGVDRFFGSTNSGSVTELDIETRLRAEVLHELTRQWIISAGLEYVTREFTDDQNDETLSAIIGAEHRFNEHYSLTGEMEFRSRESDRPGGDFDETRGIIRLNRNF